MADDRSDAKSHYAKMDASKHIVNQHMDYESRTPPSAWRHTRTRRGETYIDRPCPVLAARRRIAFAGRTNTPVASKDIAIVISFGSTRRRHRDQYDGIQQYDREQYD